MPEGRIVAVSVLYYRGHTSTNIQMGVCLWAEAPTAGRSVNFLSHVARPPYVWKNKTFSQCFLLNYSHSYPDLKS